MTNLLKRKIYQSKSCKMLKMAIKNKLKKFLKINHSKKKLCPSKNYNKNKKEKSRNKNQLKFLKVNIQNLN